MLYCMRDELLNEIIPIIEEIIDAEEKRRAKEIIKQIIEQIKKLDNGHSLMTWYLSNKSLRKEVEIIMRSEDEFASEFGSKVQWLLTKGAYFYTDD